MPVAWTFLSLSDLIQTAMFQYNFAICKTLFICHVGLRLNGQYLISKSFYLIFFIAMNKSSYDWRLFCIAHELDNFLKSSKPIRVENYLQKIIKSDWIN